MQEPLGFGVPDPLMQEFNPRSAAAAAETTPILTDNSFNPRLELNQPENLEAKLWLESLSSPGPLYEESHGLQHPDCYKHDASLISATLDGHSTVYTLTEADPSFGTNSDSGSIQPANHSQLFVTASTTPATTISSTSATVASANPAFHQNCPFEQSSCNSSCFNVPEHPVLPSRLTPPLGSNCKTNPYAEVQRSPLWQGRTTPSYKYSSTSSMHLNGNAEEWATPAHPHAGQSFHPAPLHHHQQQQQLYPHYFQHGLVEQSHSRPGLCTSQHGLVEQSHSRPGLCTSQPVFQGSTAGSSRTLQQTFKTGNAVDSMLLSDYATLHQPATPAHQVLLDNNADNYGLFRPGLQNCASVNGGRFHATPDHYTYGPPNSMLHWGPNPRAVGKSQSMRALYEENAALRRALYFMRNNCGLQVSPTMQSKTVDLGQAQSRYITSDASEGRTLSMRERGRWGMQQQMQVSKEHEGQLLAGVGGGPCNCSMYWAAVQGVQAARGHEVPTHHHQCCWYGGEGRSVPPLFSGSGADNEWVEERDDANIPWLVESPLLPNLPEMNEKGDGGGPREEVLTLKQQIQSLSIKEGARGVPAKKSHRQEKKVNGKGHGRSHRRHSSAEALSGTAESTSLSTSSGVAGVDQSLCAMCGSKLQHIETSTSSAAKKLGLPLRLCPACHPRATASHPSPISSAPPSIHPASSAQARYRAAASAISIACKPTSSTTPRKSKNRIVDLCRHFVGLTTTKPAST